MRPDLVPLRVDVAAADAAGEPAATSSRCATRAGRTPARSTVALGDPDPRRRPRARGGRDAGRRDHRPGLRDGAPLAVTLDPGARSTSATRTTTPLAGCLSVAAAAARISWRDGGAGAGSHRAPAGAARPLPRGVPRLARPPRRARARRRVRARPRGGRARGSACSTSPRRTTRRPATRCATRPTRPAGPSSSTRPACSWARRSRRSSSPTAATTRSRRSRGSSTST